MCIDTAKMNCVRDLKAVNFFNLTIEEKLKIKKRGRPVPDIKLIQTTNCKGKEVKRKFNSNVYSTYEWMCGCVETNFLYCFPCLLFARGQDVNGTWTKVGFGDISHLKQKATKHENSRCHVNAELDLKMLGRSNIGQQLDTAFRKNIEQ